MRLNTHPRVTLAAVAVVAVAGAVAILRVTHPETPTTAPDTDVLTVTADDGSATLRIPRTALPAAIDPGTIRVTRVPLTSKVPGEVAQALVYRLEPDGLQLATPAMVTITLPDADTRIPVLLHLTEKGFTPMRDVRMERDRETGVARIAAAVPHFSVLFVEFTHFRGGVFVSRRRVLVGETFEVAAGVQATGNTEKLTLPTIKVVVSTRLVSPWYMSAHFSMSQYDFRILDPDRAENKPARTSAEVPGRLGGVQTFTCTAPGEARISYEVSVEGETESLFTPEPGNRIGSSESRIRDPYTFTFPIFAGGVECVSASQAPPTRRTEDTAASGPASPSPPSVPPSAAPAENGQRVDVLIIGGQPFPARQFRVGRPEGGCAQEHYHADYEVSSIDLSTHKNDPDPGGCGFGTVKKVPRETRTLNPQEAATWR